MVDKLLTKVHLSPICISKAKAALERRQQSHVRRDLIFRRICKLTERLRVNEFVDSLMGDHSRLGVDEHRTIKMAVEARGICFT